MARLVKEVALQAFVQAELRAAEPPWVALAGTIRWSEGDFYRLLLVGAEAVPLSEGIPAAVSGEASRSLAGVLNHFRWHRFIVRIPYAQPSDPWVAKKNDPSAIAVGNAMMQIFDDPRRLAGRLLEACLIVPAAHWSVPRTIEDIQSCGERADALIVEANDGESFVAWSRQNLSDVVGPDGTR
jgi:hypothetical protein